jgi:hypothetical protein
MSGSNTSAAVAFDNLRTAVDRALIVNYAHRKAINDAIEELEQHIEGLDEDKRHLKAQLAWERLHGHQVKEAA